ncbi:MAG: N-acetylmuramoyl-L-alanine amidase [Clostridia bacterium]|nr:N-acetylmuramoyl-L-alanine amidase [Clostridia bacterium]
MPKVFIDQGHNPQNPNAGAEGNGLREQDITYEIGTILAGLLNNNPDFEARLSRNSPTEQIGTSNASSLSQRVREANEWGADIFLSLHTNAYTNPSATGVEAYAYRVGSDGFRLGEDVVEQLSLITGLNNRGTFARPSLYVLRRTGMPAALIEMGYITNPNDAALMSEQPELFALGIYNGILEYFGM